MNPKTLEDMIAHVKKYPGWTMYPPDIDAIGNRVEVAKKIAKETGTILEWDVFGSPRFMPTDYRQRMDIKAGWERCDLDSKDYGAPKEPEYNPETGEELEEGCYMMAHNTPDGLCDPITGCPGCAQERRRRAREK
jgi:hypothetical protein